MQLPNEPAVQQDVHARVAAHPFLEGMSKHHVELLARYAKSVEFKPAEIIFRAGDPAEGFYLIESGAAALEGSVMEHGQITTDIVNAGEPLGWSWLFPPYRWHFDARAVEPTKALFFDGKTLRRHYQEDLTLGHDLFQRISCLMAHRLQSARRKFLECQSDKRPDE